MAAHIVNITNNKKCFYSGNGDYLRPILLNSKLVNYTSVTFILEWKA